MNKLVEEIIKPFLNEIADTRVTKVVGVYGGRFQPFGPHHLKTYKWLQKQCDEAYITTSNIKKPPRHPMNFKEKVRHMSKMGVPSNKIIEEKSPYKAVNLAKKFDSETTAFVYVFGAKDAGRLSGGKYFQDYKKHKNLLMGYEKHGYVLTAPHISISVGGKEVSGTSMRDLLGSDKVDDKQRVKLFKKMFGYYDKGVFQMMTNKFKKLFEVDFVFKPVKIMKKLKKKWNDGKGKELLKDGKKEFVIWGIAPGKSSEDILYTKAKSQSEAKKIIKILMSKHGVKKARIQVLDLEQDPSKFWKSDKVFENALDDTNIDWLDSAMGSGNDLMMRVYRQNTDMLEDLRNKVMNSSWDKRNFYLRTIERELQRRIMVDEGEPPITEIQKLKEDIDLPIKVGDTVRMGKFKNKKVVIKSLDWNEKGDLLINGRPALKFRIEKKPNIFDEDIAMGYPDKEGMKKIKKRVNKARGKSDSSKEYQYNPIEEFLTTIDMNKIISEVTSTSMAGDADEFGAAGQHLVDSGPNMFFGGKGGYFGRNKQTAEELGWEVVNYILGVDVKSIPPTKKELDGDRNPVSFYPAGHADDSTASNKEDLTGDKAYNKWANNMKGIAQNVGFELINFMDKEEKLLKKQLSKDSKETFKKGKEEKVDESFSKDWWENILTEKVSTQDLKDVAKQLTHDYGVNPGLVLKSKVGRGDYAHFDFDRNIILISKKATRNLKEFLISILHEIDHARDFKKMGKKFIRDYETYSNMIAQGLMKGKKDPYWDNPYEVKAEKFGRKEAKKYNIKDLFGESLQENIVTKTQLKPRGKELLLMGGAYGHMAHPFDDKDLTFGDLKKIITDGLGGHLNREDGVTEKLDGQNIMVSWKDGQLIAARNKGHIKNGGETALTKSGMKSKFEGRGNIANAFNFAMTDLEKSIGALSEKQRTKIFNNGYNFMNLEVMWPASANVVDYDVAHLVFHGALVYDDKGTVKGEVKGSARMLAGMIKQVNMHIGKKYAISKPVFLTIPKHQDFGKLKSKFMGKLNKLRKEYALKDSDTLGMYHQSYWEEYIYNAAQQFKYDIPDDILKNLTKRWAFFDKSYKIPTIRVELKDEPEFLNWVLKLDKKDHSKIVKENMKPFEVLFFEVGAEILKNVEGFMAANPDKSVQRMRKKVQAAISDVRKGGDLKKLNTLKLQLDKLNKIGGTSAIVPSEGIVFKYKGNTYKFTGAFAPVNQITGLISF